MEHLCRNLHCPPLENLFPRYRYSPSNSFLILIPKYLILSVTVIYPKFKKMLKLYHDAGQTLWSEPRWWQVLQCSCQTYHHRREENQAQAKSIYISSQKKPTKHTNKTTNKQTNLFHVKWHVLLSLKQAASFLVLKPRKQMSRFIRLLEKEEQITCPCF